MKLFNTSIQAFKEIQNYFFIVNTIEKEVAKNLEWKAFNLRTDLIGRIYTVISLREEDTGEMPEVQRFKVIEKMRPINDYLSSLGFQEIVTPNIEAVPDSRSFLVTYIPIFNHFSYVWLATRIILPIGIALQFLLF